MCNFGLYRLNANVKLFVKVIPCFVLYVFFNIGIIFIVVLLCMLNRFNTDCHISPSVISVINTRIERVIPRCYNCLT